MKIVFYHLIQTILFVNIARCLSAVANFTEEAIRVMKMFILPTNQSINQQAITNKQQLIRLNA